MPELHRIKSKQTALCPATRPLADAERHELRSIIRKAQWKRSTSEKYRDAPHEYIVWFKPRGCTQKEWKRFAELIRDCGEYRQWKGSRWKYLFVGQWIYWSMWPVLNRARRSTLEDA